MRFLGFNAVRATRRKLWMLLIVLSSGGCGTEHLGPTISAGKTANTQDILVLAIGAISDFCPAVASELWSMYDRGDIYWDDVQGIYGDIGVTNSDGSIAMDYTYYGITNLDQLIADLFHEAGHSLAGLPDQGQAYDAWGRLLNYNDWDGYYSNSQCPWVW